MSDGPFRYRLFGLRLSSDVELPELSIEIAGDAETDVRVVLGKPLDAPAEDGLDAVEGGTRMSIVGAGHYIVTGGRRIEVRCEPGVPERNVRLFLLGSVMGLLLHQRGLLPLHANAIEIDGRAVAFMGVSRAGKSTLAAWFHDHGQRIIADDVCVVEFDGEGRAWAQPGIPRFRLWHKSLEAAGRTSEGLQRSYVGDDTYDKWDVPVAFDLRCCERVRLSAICILERGDALSFRRLIGLEAVEQLFAHTYRGEFVEGAGTASDHWRQCLSLIADVPVLMVERKWDLGEMDEHNKALFGMLRKQISTVRSERTPPIG